MTIKYEIMKEAGGVLREAFGLIFYYLKPGVNLEDIDYEVGKYLASKKAISGLKLIDFPFNMCASIDYEVIQGYPNRVVQEDHIISIDMSILYRGVYVDKARTVTMPSADQSKKDLTSVVNSVVSAVVPNLRSGVTLSKVGSLIQGILESNKGFRACNYFHGHGVGDYLHENPMIPNYDNGSSELLQEDQFITLEPIVYGYPLRRLFFDHKWTITSDELSAQAEDTVYINKEGAEILT
jgi:methionyl aminopeptidase